MTFTDNGTGVIYDYIPLAFANGVEWSYLRRGKKDRFDCLYRRGLINKILWYAGAVSFALGLIKLTIFEKRFGPEAGSLVEDGKYITFN